ncbi:hypothetical protein N7470_004047 [Penicillium chermesinum]|nr:hypothetical protein N7470_004047 [Penicillium chermesinum]
MPGPFHTNGVLFEPPEGFAKGNHGGLTPKELYDMTEIWTCLGVLVQPLHGKCIEARRVGIFDGIDVPENDPVREETVLEEWTSYILTLGMSAVLAISPFTPNQTPATILERAKAVGLTKWHLTEAGTTRSSFLKEAVSRVYADQDRGIPAVAGIGSPTSPSELPSQETPTREEDRERQAGFSHEIRARRHLGNPTDVHSGFGAERPMSEFSTILSNLEGIVNNHTNAHPVPPVPPLAYDRSSNSTASPAAPGTPNQNVTTEPSVPSESIVASEPEPPSVNPVSSRSPPPPTQTVAPPPMHPQVLDPVDRAIARMVGELGFYEDDVKWALKITDTGEGIDVEAAEQLLKQEKKKADRNPFITRGQGKNSLLLSVMKQQGAQDSGWRWA